ncbi:MAG: hypothetical protein A2651_01265 [Candidatus Yanofskybacteria bacterium RIFCSPHIGHO2_01_FULL_42_12]|uniref:Uncharacterized protein n=1 Tax=Candidatus Yanofskybacteria bacterium RIFCSPLOWO2_01_FULL_42_49 TaxID=1802694 RepID=A0A1F8G9R5_9BACT|nr:MAG: hypothetical protein A2651_01265 [Candidatus Yanofskybacteria bacterium RIFCSPHIGHO2_01_FULL_42_12]OGN22105.1 MAG: hypothetical protein A2918_03005 [Candidatus Yanofskybacteria bacterium RIFCSPLOWO2_01_FULL_42_49]
MFSNKKLSIILFAVLTVPFFVFSVVSADVIGQGQVFKTNETFDKFARKSMPATLRLISEHAYFYVDDDYWNDIGHIGRSDLLAGMQQLASDFDTDIYPSQTTFWGQEPKPGVDDDNRITILLEQLKSGNGGYFSTSNGYSKTLAPDSNEREMIVVSADSIGGSYEKIFLAHEFQHLISFNQKEILRDTTEDVWLNELRSEYSISLVGYNNIFYNSNIERRAQTFFDNSSDSLTEWPNVSLDYSLVALFAEYVSDQYGPDFLRETLQTNLAGIPSMNSILASRGDSNRFIDTFSGWLAASYINDSSINSEFSYSKPGLKNFKATPQRLTILSGSESSVFDYSLKPWQVYGHKFLVGGSLSNNKAIKLSPAFNSKFAYADNLGRFSILDKDFYVTDPGGLQYFFIFPINDRKISDFGKEEISSFLTLTVKFEEKMLGVDFGSVLKDGVLIKKATENETYVIEGKYKRYLRPEIIALYGHLDAVKAIEVDEATFHSYTTANYVRYVNEEQVYAVWPDGTKHWLNITPQQWDASGRDWGAIFIINDLELNNYKTGVDIIR